MTRVIGKWAQLAVPAPRAARINSLRALLLAAGAKPYGTARVAREGGQGRQLPDPDWTADLTQLVERADPHTINGPEGPQTVQVRLETLEAIVDDYDEVVGWKYVEDLMEELLKAYGLPGAISCRLEVR